MIICGLYLHIVQENNKKHDIFMTELFLVDEPKGYFRLGAIIINNIATDWNKGKT